VDPGHMWMEPVHGLRNDDHCCGGVAEGVLPCAPPGEPPEPRPPRRRLPWKLLKGCPAAVCPAAAPRVLLKACPLAVCAAAA
jgi:hypothetical protein